MPEAATLGLGWYPDPVARHERRFHDGRRWTEHVANGDVLALDALQVDAPPAVVADESPAPAAAPMAARAPARSDVTVRRTRFDAFEWCFKLAMVALLVAFLVVAGTALGN